MRLQAVQIIKRSAVITIVVMVVGGLIGWGLIGANSVIKVNAQYPTAIKPQSKLWYAHSRWWAWLPDGDRSSIWMRRHQHWERVANTDSWLSEVPGHADVWADGDGVAAVLVSPQQITVARLVFDVAQQQYVPGGAPTIWRHPTTSPELASQCATIARDRRGRYWIAYDMNGVICVRATRSQNLSDWQEPIPVSEKLDDDDIGVIFQLSDGVGVAWTDQPRDAICFRRHTSDQPYAAWDRIEIVEQGSNVANNHLSAAVSTDGSVYLASKTNDYIPGKPLLIMRVRNPEGQWKKVPIAEYTTAITPTRPIALLTAEEAHICVVYTALDNSPWNSHAIVSSSVNRRTLEPPASTTLVIGPHLDMRNATSCKGLLPKDAEWVVLASDRWGNVYEGMLRSELTDPPD